MKKKLYKTRYKISFKKQNLQCKNQTFGGLPVDTVYYKIITELLMQNKQKINRVRLTNNRITGQQT